MAKKCKACGRDFASTNPKDEICYPCEHALKRLNGYAVHRPKGRWIWNEENECWICSNCELSALNNYRGNSTDSEFCPHCGADMREGIDGR